MTRAFAPLAQERKEERLKEEQLLAAAAAASLRLESTRVLEHQLLRDLHLSELITPNTTERRRDQLRDLLADSGRETSRALVKPTLARPMPPGVADRAPAERAAAATARATRASSRSPRRAASAPRIDRDSRDEQHRHARERPRNLSFAKRSFAKLAGAAATVRRGGAPAPVAPPVPVTVEAPCAVTHGLRSETAWRSPAPVPSHQATPDSLASSRPGSALRI